ncbi:MAG: hypothetical protein NUW01_07110, partial [Gemmatimonadaceae bacterium]|nr:hypothetical protein [Gemmatimonadaceae bacterium]
EGRLWTFTPSPTADPAPGAYTIEYVERSTADDAEMEAGYGLTTEIEISGPDTGLPQLRQLLVARKTADSTKTASLALPAVAYAANARWAVYIDTTWAGLGGTQISAQVYGLTWRLSDWIRVAYYHDNRSDLDFSQYEIGRLHAELEIDVVHDPATAKLIQTQEALKTAGTTQFIRCQLNGAAFSAPDTALARFIRLDGAYSHMADSMQERGGDRDGNLMTRLHLRSIYDATSTSVISVAVQNNLTAFP